MRFVPTLALVFLMSFTAQAADLPRVVSKGAEATALTIYPDNLALITETRTVDLPLGKSTIVFEGVNDRMISASALLREFSGFTIERNFDYALLNKANLFEKSVGETVTLTRTHHKSGKVTRDKAKIISAGEGVVFEIDGKYETFQCSGLSEGTWFANLPEGLNGMPELSMDVDAIVAGPQQVVISYLADNFSWESDYRLDLKPDGKSGKLNGWLTINNQTSQTFIKAPTAIIAGHLNRNYQTRAQDKVDKTLYAQCWQRQSTKTPISHGAFAAASPLDVIVTAESRSLGVTPAPKVVFDSFRDEFQSKKEAVEEEFGDYKLYRTAEPVTVAAYQTKQVRFISRPEVEVEKINGFDFNFYDLRNRDKIRSIQQTNIEYRLDNDRDGKLAKALPKGTMRVLTHNADDRLLVIGETDVVDTAVDNPMKIYLDPSSLVQVQTTVKDYSSKPVLGKGTKIDFDLSHAITNASDADAAVEFNIIGAYKSLEFYTESLNRDPEVGPIGWAFIVPASETVELKFKGRYFQ